MKRIQEGLTLESRRTGRWEAKTKELKRTPAVKKGSRSLLGEAWEGCTWYDQLQSSGWMEGGGQHTIHRGFA